MTPRNVFAEKSTIALARWEKHRRLTHGDLISDSPACWEIGKDREGDNLRVFSFGDYHWNSLQQNPPKPSFPGIQRVFNTNT